MAKSISPWALEESSEAHYRRRSQKAVDQIRQLSHVYGDDVRDLIEPALGGSLQEGQRVYADLGKAQRRRGLTRDERSRLLLARRALAALFGPEVRGNTDAKPTGYVTFRVPLGAAGAVVLMDQRTGRAQEVVGLSAAQLDAIRKVLG